MFEWEDYDREYTQIVWIFMWMSIAMSMCACVCGYMFRLYSKVGDGKIWHDGWVMVVTKNVSKTLEIFHNNVHFTNKLKYVVNNQINQR